MSVIDALPCDDDLFGPGVPAPGCRGGLDFTAFFEAAILTSIPAALLLILAPLRFYQLSKSAVHVRRSGILYLKIAVAAVLVCLHITGVVLVTSSKDEAARPAKVAGAALASVASVVVLTLSPLEHLRSIRPSLLLTLYFSVTILLDAACVRTAWLTLPSSNSTHQISIASSLTAELVLKVLFLSLETVEKQRWFLVPDKIISGENKSGPLSRGIFAWLNGFLITGFSALLAPSSLPGIHDKILSDPLLQRFRRAWASSNHPEKYTLLEVILKCFIWEIVEITIPRLCLVAFSIAQPFMVGKATMILEFPGEYSSNLGYGLLGAFAIVLIGAAMSTAIYQHLGYRMTTMLRGALMATVYQKMMVLPLGELSEHRALGLIGSDIEALSEYFHAAVCETWANILQLGLATWLLYTQLGAVCIAPIIVVIAFTAVSLGMGNAISKRQKSWLGATEKRISFTTETLAAIKNVKMLGLAEPIADMIAALRTHELRISKKFRTVQSLRVCIVNLPMTIGQLLTFAAYAIVAKFGGTSSLSVSQAVTALSLINLLINPLQMLLYAIPDTFSAMGCISRVQDFLHRHDRLDTRDIGALARSRSHSLPSGTNVELAELEPVAHSKPDTQGEQLAVSFDSAIFGWTSASLPASGFSMKTSRSPYGSLTMIIGPVGSGKTTFLKTLTGEVPLRQGRLHVQQSDIAFCNQTAWLYNATIRENIIGQTDGVFETGWYNSVVSACALDIDFTHLPLGDATIVGSKGMKLSGGQRQRIALARAVYSRKLVVCVDDVLSGLDNVTGQAVFSRIFGPSGLLRSLGAAVYLATHTVHHLSSSDYVIVLSPGCRVVEHGTFEQLRESGGYVRSLDIQAPSCDEHKNGFISNSCDSIIYSGITGTPEEEEERTRPIADRATYRYYLKALGWLKMGVFVSLVVVNTGVSTFRYIWLTIWADSSDNNGLSRTGYWLGIFAGLAVIEGTTLCLGALWAWVVIVPAASKNLHSTVLKTTMSASISFLTSTETGLLINRFSQDMRLVDIVLPRAFVPFFWHFFGVLGFIAIAFASLPYIVAAVPLILGLLILIQRFYLRTSRQLRLLEIETKGPLFEHFIESLAGLATIRAFGWTDPYMAKTLRLLDVAQKPFYLLLSIQRWLGLVLDLTVAGFTLLLLGIALALRDRINAGLLGLALVVLIGLGQSLTSLIQSWTLLETSLGAITRIKNFVDNTPQEHNIVPSYHIDKSWPAHGSVAFENASVAYSEGSKPVLSDITLDIVPREKIGLCGRTGSGKSSMVMSILRLADCISGTVKIDGQNITQLPHEVIRQRISCLSQEPFVFAASVRVNADPTGVRTDEEIVEALQQVGLWKDIVAAQDGGDALEAVLDEKALSHGQRQLFGLARALLRRSNILVLDEPTSSLDKQTDLHIQAVIRSAFKNCTVIMVAHRIRTLLDFDRVAVMDAGRIAELGKPGDLLQREDGLFAGLALKETIQSQPMEVVNNGDQPC